WRVRKHAERCALILRVHNVENPRDHHRHIPDRVGAVDIELAQPVQDHHRESDDRGPQAQVHPSISFNASEHESHTGPVNIEYFQQRSHSAPSALSTVTFTSSPGSRSTCETMKSAGKSSA